MSGCNDASWVWEFGVQGLGLYRFGGACGVFLGSS